MNCKALEIHASISGSYFDIVMVLNYYRRCNSIRKSSRFWRIGVNLRIGVTYSNTGE